MKIKKVFPYLVILSDKVMGFLSLFIIIFLYLYGVVRKKKIMIPDRSFSYLVTFLNVLSVFYLSDFVMPNLNNPKFVINPRFACINSAN